MIQQWLEQVRKSIIQEVPPEIARCEFDCRVLNCMDCPFVKSHTLGYQSNACSRREFDSVDL